MIVFSWDASSVVNLGQKWVLKGEITFLLGHKTLIDTFFLILHGGADKELSLAKENSVL